MSETPYVVGLTGGIGSGKSAAADLLAARGALVVDTDQIAHQLTAPGGAAMEPIREAFGNGVVAADGALNRPAMRALAFEDPDARKRLEAILHPMIRDESERQCRAATAPYVILAVPLLIESGTYRARCDRIVVVDCPESLQVERVMSRSGIGRDEVLAIMAAQASRAERLAVADDVVLNDGERAKIDPQVRTIHQKYLRLSAEKVKAGC